MDIDSPMMHAGSGQELSDFGLRYPLPLRIVALSAVTALGFASNLHLLTKLGIDTAHVLDIRLELAQPTPAGAPPPPLPHVHPSTLYPPVYTLALSTLAWTGLGWLVHRSLTGAAHPDPALVVHYRLAPVALALAVVAALCWPANVLHRPARFRLLRALRRIVTPKLNAHVPFCDIILADILTSSAKVLGDVWLAGCLVLTGEGVSGVAGDACKRVWGVPLMTSLPYLFRFRQCLSEVYTRSTPTPRRSLLNALKYATAFPVIALSAMQTVIGDPFDGDEEVHEAGERWIGRTTLFNLWILAVLINSMYSFWWDVTNDWGLSLLSRSGWSSSPAVSYAFINPPPASAHATTHAHIGARGVATGSTHAASSSGHGRARSLIAPGHGHSLAAAAAAAAAAGSAGDAPLLRLDAHDHAHSHPLASTTFPPAPSRPHTPTPPSPKPASLSPLHAHRGHSHSRAFSTSSSPNLTFPFLRPILLLPDPWVYYLAIALDLLLRLTWSLKLSSHLHSAQEVESGVFAVEALEVVRRWMWVFLRVEWEAVRKGAGNDGAGTGVGPPSGLAWMDAKGGDGGGGGGGAEGRLRALNGGGGGGGDAHVDEYELGGVNGGGGGGGKGKGRALDPIGAGDEEEALGLLPPNGYGHGRGAVREGELI